MADVHVLLVAIERYQDANLSAVPQAESGANALAATLRAQGIADGQLTLLTNAGATKTIIESKIRQLAKKREKGDSLLVFLIGHVVSSAGQNYFLAADAVVDDLLGTALPLADLWNRLIGAKVPFTVFLDAGAMPNAPATLAEEEILPHAISDELAELAESTDRGVLFASATQDEASASDSSRRVWLDLVREGFAGKIAAGPLTVRALRDYIDHELPRSIRKSLANPVRQTPQVWGVTDPDRVILNVRSLEAGSIAPAGVDLEQLKRVAFRAETTQRFKSLTGFQKGHRVPDQVTPYTEKFLAKIAQDDIRADIEEIYNALREHLHFKRKDLEASTESDGSGFIRTPQFDYTLSARLDRDDPSTVIWRREVTNLSDPLAVQSSPFQAVFGNTFDRLVFEFATPLDVATLVDHIEDTEAAGVKVRLSSDESNCVITIDGFAGSIRVDRDTLQIEGRQSQTSASLIQQFFEFQRRFAASLDLKQLPLGQGDE